MSIKVVFDSPDIIQKIGEKTVEVINAAINKSAPTISNRIGELLVNTIKQGRTYQSIISGDLRYELGLSNPESSMSPVLSALKKSVEFNFEPFKYYRGKITGKFSISLLTNGLKEILNVSTSTYYSNNYEIKWLDWILTKGDSVIVLDYHIVTDLNAAQESYSRTGEALMFKGGTWRVPPQYSGTPDDNFIIWSVESREFQSKANQIINEELKKVF